MQALADIQSAFTDALHDPDRPAPEALISAQPGRPSGLDVYRNNRIGSLVDVLAGTYVAVHRLVGEAFFRGAARVYVDREPPRSPILHDYGATFGDFLDGFPPAASVPYLGDVARLEWSCLRAYHAPDADPVPIQALAGLAASLAPRVRLDLHPSLALHRSRWPTGSLWSALRGADDASDVDMTRAEEVLVVRPALAVDVHVLPPRTHPFVSALAGGATLEQAAARAQAGCERFDLAMQLQGLFDLGAVVAIHAPMEEDS